MSSRDQWVVMDVAPVGPDHIPGHAHADTLSFEWSLQAPARAGEFRYL